MEGLCADLATSTGLRKIPIPIMRLTTSIVVSNRFNLFFADIV
jgi:hypothetical protein